VDGSNVTAVSVILRAVDPVGAPLTPASALGSYWLAYWLACVRHGSSLHDACWGGSRVRPACVLTTRCLLWTASALGSYWAACVRRVSLLHDQLLLCRLACQQSHHSGLDPESFGLGLFPMGCFLVGASSVWAPPWGVLRASSVCGRRASGVCPYHIRHWAACVRRVSLPHAAPL
jgi:hypothetical protein